MGDVLYLLTAQLSSRPRARSMPGHDGSELVLVMSWPERQSIGGGFKRYVYSGGYVSAATDRLAIYWDPRGLTIASRDVGKGDDG